MGKPKIDNQEGTQKKDERRRRIAFAAMSPRFGFDVV